MTQSGSITSAVTSNGWAPHWARCVTQTCSPTISVERRRSCFESWPTSGQVPHAISRPCWVQTNTSTCWTDSMSPHGHHHLPLGTATTARRQPPDESSRPSWAAGGGQCGVRCGSRVPIRLIGTYTASGSKPSSFAMPRRQRPPLSESPLYGPPRQPKQSRPFSATTTTQSRPRRGCANNRASRTRVIRSPMWRRSPLRPVHSQPTSTCVNATSADNGPIRGRRSRRRNTVPGWNDT